MSEWCIYIYSLKHGLTTGIIKTSIHPSICDLIVHHNELKAETDTNFEPQSGTFVTKKYGKTCTCGELCYDMRKQHPKSKLYVTGPTLIAQNK